LLRNVRNFLKLVWTLVLQLAHTLRMFLVDAQPSRFLLVRQEQDGDIDDVLHTLMDCSSWHVRAKLRARWQVWRRRWGSSDLELDANHLRCPGVSCAVSSVRERHHRWPASASRHCESHQVSERSLPESKVCTRGIFARCECDGSSYGIALQLVLFQDSRPDHVWRSEC
jgi:hypothetical protein